MTYCSYTGKNNKIKVAQRDIMWRKVALIIVALIAVTFSTAQTYGGYSLYQNYRFGYYLRYPNYMDITSQSGNGDGVAMHSYDKSISISVGAMFNLFNDSTYNLMSENVSSYRSKGYSITYSYINDDYIVLSGYTPSGKIYYLKEVVCTIYSPGYEEYVEIIASAYMECSLKDKSKGDDIIKQFKYFPFKP